MRNPYFSFTPLILLGNVEGARTSLDRRVNSFGTARTSALFAARNASRLKALGRDSSPRPRKHVRNEDEHRMQP